MKSSVYTGTDRIFIVQWENSSKHNIVDIIDLNCFLLYRNESHRLTETSEHALGKLDLDETDDDSPTMSVTAGRKRTRNGLTDESPERDGSPPAPKRTVCIHALHLPSYIILKNIV